MSVRLILCAVLPAGLLGIAAAAAVWVPGDGDLSLSADGYTDCDGKPL